MKDDDLKRAHPEVRRAIRYAVEELQWRYKILQNSLIMLFAPDGKGKVTTSCTPKSTNFIYTKILADIKREIRRHANG